MTRILQTRLLRRALHPSSLFLGVIAAAVILLGSHAAYAQDIEQITRDASGHGLNTFAMGFNLFCWALGGSLFIIAIWGWYQHTRNPNAGARLGTVFAGIVAGGLLLTLPFVVRTATFTLFGTSASVDGSQQMMRFDK